jgi:hypothetical protein
MALPNAGFAVLLGTCLTTVGETVLPQPAYAGGFFANTPLWRSNYAIHPIAIAGFIRYFTGDGLNYV